MQHYFRGSNLDSKCLILPPVTAVVKLQLIINIHIQYKKLRPILPDYLSPHEGGNVDVVHSFPVG